MNRKIFLVINSCLIPGLVFTGIWKYKLQKQAETDVLSAEISYVDKPDPIFHLDEKTGFIHGDWEKNGYYSYFDQEKECGVYLEGLKDPDVSELIFGKYCVAVYNESEQEGEEPINKNPFAGCPKLREISVEDGARWMTVKDGMLLAATDDGRDIKGVFACVPATTGEIKVPDGAGFVGGFNGCRQIKKLSIPSSVKNIGDGELGNMSACTEFTVDADNRYYCSIEGVIYTKDKKELVAYPAGKKDSVYRIADGTEYIRSGAFIGSEHLKKIQVPHSLRNERMNANEYAFTGCDARRVAV